MRGHLARRGDRYYAVVYEGIDPATGKERRRWYPAGATRKAAEKVLGGSRKMTIWSADELREFLAGIEDGEWYVPIYLAANTGMRRSEVLGMPWRNVDLDTARHRREPTDPFGRVRHTVADVKTTNSRRTIDLDPRTVAVLRLGGVSSSSSG